MITHYHRVSAGCAVSITSHFPPLSLKQVSNACFLEVMWIAFAVPGLDWLA